jgi:hypothetical protein
MDVFVVPYENLLCPPSNDRLWPPAQQRAQGYSRGKLPRLSWAAGYGPKTLGYDWFPTAAYDCGTIHPILVGDPTSIG